jgi:hypothetical protein
MSDPRASTTEPSFARLAGWSAILAGIDALTYAVAFVVLKSDALAAIALLAGGLLTLVAILGLRDRLRAFAPRLADLGALLGVVGALGASIHGAYDLANVLNPPATTVDLPNAIDPRGFLTFGVSGLGVWILSWAALLTGRGLPRPLAGLGIALGILLVVVYVGRLIVLDATSPLILGPAAITGFLASPLFYLWLGTELIGRSDGA